MTTRTRSAKGAEENHGCKGANDSSRGVERENYPKAGEGSSYLQSFTLPPVRAAKHQQRGLRVEHGNSAPETQDSDITPEPSSTALRALDHEVREALTANLRSTPPLTSAYSTYQDLRTVQTNRMFNEPLLSREDEVRLFYTMKSGGPEAEAAKERFVLSNLRIVEFLVRRHFSRFATPSMNEEDIFQEGVAGLRKAVDGFNPEAYPDCRFTTYAAWSIKKHMLLAIATKSEVVRKPSHLQQLGYRALRISENLRTESQRSPSAKEIAQVINRQRAGTKTPPVDGDRVSDALAAVRAHTVSGETPLGNSPDSDTIFSRLVDTQVSDPSGADSSHNYSSVISLVQGLMGILSNKEREVVRLRLPVDPQESPLTLEEIGGRFNYTRERIRQIEASALKKLRDALERRGIKGSTVF